MRVAGQTANAGSFGPGNAGGPGRPRGSRNRVSADLAADILEAAAEAGFMKRDDDGNLMPTGEGGVKGYLKWSAIHEVKTYLGLLARILPYAAGTPQLPTEEIITHEEVLAQLEERGLPVDLVGVLREAPAVLDPGEDEDPFGMKTSDGEVVKETDQDPFGMKTSDGEVVKETDQDPFGMKTSDGEVVKETDRPTNGAGSADLARMPHRMTS